MLHDLNEQSKFAIHVRSWNKTYVDTILSEPSFGQKGHLVLGRLEHLEAGINGTCNLHWTLDRRTHTGLNCWLLFYNCDVNNIIGGGLKQFFSCHNLISFCLLRVGATLGGIGSQLAAGAAQLVALEHMCASKNKSAVNTLGAAATIHLKEVLCVF